MFHEREMYDMMGIVFEGNRDLRRIYMSPDYRSFPQRRDFVLPDDAADYRGRGRQPARASRDLGPRPLQGRAARSSASAYPRARLDTTESGETTPASTSRPR